MLHGVLLTWFHFSSLCEELRKASVPPRGPGHRSAHLLGLMGLQRARPGREQGRVQPQLCPRILVLPILGGGKDRPCPGPPAGQQELQSLRGMLSPSPDSEVHPTPPLQMGKLRLGWDGPWQPASGQAGRVTWSPVSRPTA